MRYNVLKATNKFYFILLNKKTFAAQKKYNFYIFNFLFKRVRKI